MSRKLIYIMLKIGKICIYIYIRKTKSEVCAKNLTISENNIGCHFEERKKQVPHPSNNEKRIKINQSNNLLNY